MFSFCGIVLNIDMEVIMDSLEKKHYKRSKYMIEKLKRTFPNYIYNQKQEQQLIQNELVRYLNVAELANYDFINICFLISVALLGLNKESIEKNEKHTDYEYPVKYKENKVVITDSAGNIDELQAKQMLTRINNFIDSEMEKGRIKNTSYDEWLSIKNENLSLNYNYMFNIRNSLMHSEYCIDLFIGRPLFAHLLNSNYTGFEATVFVPKFLEFLKHYFSNDAFFGVVDDLYLFSLEDGVNISSDHELKSYLKSQVQIFKLEYENKKKRKLFEKVILDNPKVPNKKLIDKYGIKSNDVVLDDEQINQIVLNLKDYYGEKLYNMEKDKIDRIIAEAIRYELNPKSVISAWLMHFYDMFSKISQLVPFEDDFISGFALKPTLLVLKSYNVLYRLQNKELQKYGFNYDLMYDINYSFDVNVYNSFRDKLIEKSDYKDELDTKKKFFTEVFRNSLAHGNIDFFCVENGETIEKYIKFEDKYKSRIRTVSVTLNEFDEYLCSECFESSQLKENSIDDMEMDTIHKR